jgi:hypothetical protein
VRLAEKTSVPAQQPPGDPRREVAPALVHALLSYIERAAGREVLDRVLAAGPVGPDEAMDSRRWFSAAEATAIADVAADICHDGNIGRAAGAELWRMLCASPGYLDNVRSAGSVTEAIRAAAGRASKISTGRSIVVSDVGADELTLFGHYGDPNDAHPFFCGTSVGFFAQIPAAFGRIGEAVEVVCQGDGADDCRYRISWFEDATRPQLDDAAINDSLSRAQSQLHQLEQIHQLTAELLGADRVDEVLARITREAGHAVQAPRYLLAVRVNDRDKLRWPPATRGGRPSLRSTGECLRRTPVTRLRLSSTWPRWSRPATTATLRRRCSAWPVASPTQPPNMTSSSASSKRSRK